MEVPPLPAHLQTVRAAARQRVTALMDILILVGLAVIALFGLILALQYEARKQERDEHTR